MFDMQNAHSLDAGSDSATTQQVADLRAEGFTEQEIERLYWARYRVERGSLSEWDNDDYKRLRFARWLYERGKISET
jgi:hypothetical protein